MGGGACYACGLLGQASLGHPACMGFKFYMRGLGGPLLTWHGGRLQAWLPESGCGLGWRAGSPLFDEAWPMAGVGMKDTEHLLLLHGGAGRPESPREVL